MLLINSLNLFILANMLYVIQHFMHSTVLVKGQVAQKMILAKYV